jgi:hypothetical protein
LTHDLDFSAILAATKGKKPSVIQIRARTASPRLWAPPSSPHLDIRQPISKQALY